MHMHKRFVPIVDGTLPSAARKQFAIVISIYTNEMELLRFDTYMPHISQKQSR